MDKVLLFGYPAIGLVILCVWCLVGMNAWLAISSFGLPKDFFGFGINYICQAIFFSIIGVALQKMRGASNSLAAADGTNNA
jgi:hypothetical protein